MTMEQKETKMFAAIAQTTPTPVSDLKEGETKYWCRCGLSKTQPWCDGSHGDTGITPLKWTVDKTDNTYYICNCKQTKKPPFCDGSHVSAPAEMDKRVKSCKVKGGHVENCKLCTNCGWVPDF